MKLKKKTKKVLLWVGGAVVTIGGVVIAVKTGRVDKVIQLFKKIPVKVLADAGINGGKHAIKNFRKKFTDGDLWSCIGAKQTEYVAEGYDMDEAMEMAAFE